MASKTMGSGKEVGILFEYEQLPGEERPTTMRFGRWLVHSEERKMAKKSKMRGRTWWSTSGGSTSDPFVRTPRFRAWLADGRVFEGSIQGSGGRLGNGATQAGQRGAERAAWERLASWIRLAEASPVPARAYVSMVPTGPEDHGDGEWEARVEVPLVGTRFDLLPARSVECGACDGLGVVARGFELSECRRCS